MAIDYFAQQFGKDTSETEPDYTQMMLDRYATIGRTGVGTGASNVDKEGLDNWVRALQEGQVTPADLDARFSTAVTDYMAQNPNDQYTNYVKDYQAKQAGTTGEKIQTTGGGDINATSNVDNSSVTGALAQATVTTPTNTYFQANPDVAAAYAANNYGLTPDQFASTHYTNSGQSEGRVAPAGTPVISAPRSLLDTNTATVVDTQVKPNYRQMVLDAYGSIGRTGIGTEANQVDAEGADAFTKALETGQIKPEDFNKTFQTAVVDYLASKPEDKYSTYVTNYLTQNKPAALAGVIDLYQNVLGRAPDPKGLADAIKLYGTDISAEDKASFTTSAQAELDSRIQDLYSEFLGSERKATKEDKEFWAKVVGNKVDASKREQFRQAAAAELSGAFGAGGVNSLAGFKYAKDLGISDAQLKTTLGEDLYNQYKNQLKTTATTSINDIVADNALTFEESQKIANLARDLNFNSQQLADLTGKDKSLFDTILTNYDTNRTKIINDTLTGANVLTEADRVVASYALEKQFGFTDADIAKATGVDVKVIQNSLNPVRNFESDFSKIANNTDSTTQQIKDFVISSKANSAIDKLYGSALTGYENKIAELETKWSAYGSDAIQSENLFQQLNAQKNALGGNYFQGVFGDLENSAALLVKKGLDTIGDLGQKDKFITAGAVEVITTADGQRVSKVDNEYFVPINDSEGSFTGRFEKVDPSSVTKKYLKYEDDGQGNSVAVPLSEQELKTLKDGTYQQKIGSVVIDKDTGKEITDTTGQLAFQKSGGVFTGKNHWLNVKFTDDGTPYLTATTEKSGINAFVSEMGPMVISIAAMIPGPHQPFAMAANAAIALEQKNYLGAVLSGLGSYGTFTGNELTMLNAAEAAGDIVNTSRILELQNTASNIKLAQTAVSGFAALQSENIAGVINASLSAYGQTGGTLPSGVTTAFQAANLALALDSNNVSAALTSLGDLTGSKDLYVAASAKNLIDALKSGNEANILQAGLVFGNAFQASNQTTATNTGTTAASTAASTVPDKTINDAVNTELNNQLTFDASGSANVNAASQAADAAGYNKFTFDGKTYTIDNNNAANTIAQLEADALVTNTAANLKGGDMQGVDAQAAATAKANNTVIGNTEADNPDEAAYLAKQRNPTGTTFTFGGNTYTMGGSSLAVDRAINEAKTEELKNNIANASTRDEAFRIARQGGLGAKDVFTWQGKSYTAATAEERPDLADAISARNLATTTNASSTVAAQNDLLARNAVNQSDAETARLARQNTTIASMEKTGIFETMANAIQGQMKLSSEAANDFLKNNPNSPITNSVSTAYEAAGNLEKNVAGGLALLTNNKPLADAFVKSGNDLTEVGKSIGNGVVDTKNWNDTMSLVQGAQGWEKLGVVAGRIMDGTSGLGRQVEVELRQELPGLFLGGGSVRGILVATGAMDTLETAGDAALNAYDAGAKKGLSHAASLSEARTAGVVAGMTEAALQLTLGKLADFGAGKISNIGTKTGTKVVGEGIVEGTQEGGAALAVDLALGNTLDANKYLTQAVAGSVVGKGTAVATTPADIATTETINNNITAAVTSGNAASVNTAITNSVQTSLSGGSSVEIAVGASVNSAITNGADTNTSITAAVSSAVESGADVNQTVTASIDSAITAGADTTTAINSTVSSAITSGADVSKTVSSSITAATSAGVNANTAITTTVDSAVTTALSSNVNATTAIETSVTAAINAAVNANVNANTNASVNANVNAAVNAAVAAAVNAGVDTNIAVNSAINAVVNANINPNININIENLKTSATETATSATEKNNLISSVNDLISGTPTATPATKTPTPTLAPKVSAGLTAGLVGGAVMAGELGRLPPQMLKAYMTQDKFVDPLAKLQALQEDMNTEKMPALPQVNTQEEDMPDQGTWKYGNAPDNLDTLFGEKEEEEEGSLGFKAGGFVAPLQMASGGAMPLPLLVKSGGALGALPRGDGRLDFRHGAHVAGEGDGQSDDIKAMLADGEFVFPADVVSALGNGSTKAGSDKLYEMMHSIRERARSKKPKDLPPPALKSPLDYLKKVRS